MAAKILYRLNKSNRYVFKYSAIGGENLKKQGVKSILPIEDLSIMGLFEIIPSIPKLFKHLWKTYDHIIEFKPDLIVTVDSPGFNFRLVKRLRKNNINARILHIVAPTVWAWKSYRAKKISQIYDYLFVLLPFETELFTKHGLKTEFIGHPSVEKEKELILKDFYDEFSLKSNDTVISIYPGSRYIEVKRHLRILLNTMEDVSDKVPNLIVFCVTIKSLKSK